MTNPKNYYRPKSAEEAANLLSDSTAYPLGGGAMTLNTLDFPHETVVDLQDISELNNIYTSKEGVVIGGAVKLEMIVQDEHVPLPFKQAITRTLPQAVRANTSLMETLLTDNPPREWVALLSAYDVRLTMMNPQGQQDPFSITETALVAGQEVGRSLRNGLLMAMFIPRMHDGEAIGMAHVARTPVDEAIVNAAVIVKMKKDGTVLGAFAALCGVSNRQPVEVMAMGDLYNKPLTAEYIAAQCAHIPHVINPPDDYLGSEDYRREMAMVVLRRALEDAAAQLNA